MKRAKQDRTASPIILRTAESDVRTREFTEALLPRMQTTAAKEAMFAALNASPAQRGAAAVWAGSLTLMPYYADRT